MPTPPFILCVFILLVALIFEGETNHANCESAKDCPLGYINDPDKYENLCEIYECNMKNEVDVESCCICVSGCAEKDTDYGSLWYHLNHSDQGIGYLGPIIGDCFSIYFLVVATYLYFCNRGPWSYCFWCSLAQVFFFSWDIVNHLFIEYESQLHIFRIQLLTSRLSLVSILIHLCLLFRSEKITVFACLFIWLVATPYFSKIEGSGEFETHRYAWRTHLGVVFGNYLAFYLPSWDSKKELKVLNIENKEHEQ